MISGGNKVSILDNMFGNEDSMEKAMKEMGEQFFYIKVLGAEEPECTRLLQKAQDALAILKKEGQCERIKDSENIAGCKVTSQAVLVINDCVIKNGSNLEIEDIVELLKKF